MPVIRLGAAALFGSTRARFPPRTIETQHVQPGDMKYARRQNWLPGELWPLYGMGERRERHHELLDAVSAAARKLTGLDAELQAARQDRIDARVAKRKPPPRPDADRLREDYEEALAAAEEALVRFADDTAAVLREHQPDWREQKEAQRAANVEQRAALMRQIAELDLAIQETDGELAWIASLDPIEPNPLYVIRGFEESIAEAQKPKPKAKTPDSERLRRQRLGGMEDSVLVRRG